MKTLVGAVLASFMVCGSAAAQSTEADISARLMGKPLQLRGFWMDDKLKFDEAGSPVGSYKTGSFTQSGFHTEKVKVSGDHLKLEGRRVGIEFERDGFMQRELLLLPKGLGRDAVPEKMTIEIDGHHSTDFSNALDTIFAGSVGELASSLPEYWQEYARKNFQPETDAAGRGAVDATSGERTSKIGGRVRPPHLIHNVDPEFSETARRQKYSGIVRVGLWVEKDGSVSHITIQRPAGMGLDEKAVEAVQQYQFMPAMRDGVPERVELSADVNFRIF
jgi:TonB family protein